MNISDSEHALSVDPEATMSGEIMPSLLRFWRVLRHRKHVVLCVLYTFCLAGGIYYFLAPRLYRSSARILIVDQNPEQMSAVGSHDTTGNTMATHRELVVSPIVIQRAIQQLDPQFRIDLLHERPRDWVETIQEELRASITRKTNIIDVGFRSRKPEAAAAVVREVIAAYLDFVEENHKGTASEFSALLTQKRDQIQATLVTKQAELQRLREQVGHLAVSSEDQVIEPVIQRALRLNEALLEAQEKRIILQATLASVEEASARGESINQHLMGIESTLGRQLLLASLGLGPEDMRVVGEQKKALLASHQEMQNLSGVYGPNHPRMLELRKQIQSLQKYLESHFAGAGKRLDNMSNAVPDEVILKMLRQAVHQARQIEGQLEESYELARSKAAAQSGALVQLRTLEREVARTEALSDSLIDSIANMDMRQVQAPIKATVIREPLPDEKPVSPQLRFVLFVCLAGGMIVGGLIVYVQDILDDRFNSPEELSSQLGVPILSIVRELDPLPGEGLASVVTYTQPNSMESEAFRTLRTTLSLNGDVTDRILISSSEPGDGKTTISANLAVAFAQAGKRTLLIDADLRRPGLSALLGLKGQQGVADVLASDEAAEATATRLVHHTELEGLDILPVGLRRPNPAELLSGNAFVELLAWADSQYDRVLVDCPPVLAVSDAQIVGQLVDGAILVVRPDKNHRRSVMRAVEGFQATGCRVLGVVANSVSGESSEYGYSYGYEYGYGHEESSEELIAPATDAAERFSETLATPPPPVSTSERIRPRRAA